MICIVRGHFIAQLPDVTSMRAQSKKIVWTLPLQTLPTPPCLRHSCLRSFSPFCSFCPFSSLFFSSDMHPTLFHSCEPLRPAWRRSAFCPGPAYINRQCHALTAKCHAPTASGPLPAHPISCTCVASIPPCNDRSKGPADSLHSAEAPHKIKAFDKRLARVSPH